MNPLYRIAAFSAIILLSAAAQSQTFPSKPLKIVVPTQGVSVDLYPRLLTPILSAGFGQQVIIENRTGGSGIPGTDYVAKSAPDGYTILHGTTSNLISVMFLMKNVPYDPYKDFTPLAAGVQIVDFVMIRSSLPVKTFRELVDYAKQNPGKLSYGSGGAGAYHHLVGETLQMATGMQLLHVPFKSVALAGPEVMADRIDMTFGTIPGTRAFVSGGKAKLVAYIGGNSRYPGLPEIPGIGESFPSFEKPPSWFAFWGPAGMPQPIVTRWNAEVVKAMNSAEGLAWLETNGGYVYGGPPEKLAQMMREGTEIYRKIVTTAGLKPE